MQNTTKKKSGAIISAVIISLLLLSYVGVFLFVFFQLGVDSVALGILALYTVVIIVSIVCVLYALKQRLKELNSGEEEEAKKY